MSYSPFHKISRHDRDAEFITVKDSETVLIKGLKYRKAWTYGFDRQIEIDHYILDQQSCNKLNVSNIWYVECKAHPCVWNCIDSQQTDKQWLKHLRSPQADKRNVRNALRAMEKFGYTNSPKKGYRKVG